MALVRLPPLIAAEGAGVGSEVRAALAGAPAARLVPVPVGSSATPAVGANAGCELTGLAELTGAAGETGSCAAGVGEAATGEGAGATVVPAGEADGVYSSADAKYVQDVLHHHHRVECPVKCIQVRQWAVQQWIDRMDCLSLNVSRLDMFCFAHRDTCTSVFRLPYTTHWRTTMLWRMQLRPCFLLCQVGHCTDGTRGSFIEKRQQKTGVGEHQRDGQVDASQQNPASEGTAQVQ
jgi:hypothetical protein